MTGTTLVTVFLIAFWVFALMGIWAVVGKYEVHEE